MTNLVFGYTWKQIQKAQQKMAFREYIPSTPTGQKSATQADVDLLVKHGLEGLREMQFFGVIDRLQGSGLI